MIYNIVIYFVLWGIAIASLFNEKVRKMWRGEREAFKILKQKVDPNAKYIWFHAASLGEFEQGRPLMERIRKDYPQYKILLTFYSPSGYEVRKNYEGADIICYMPVDTRLNAIRFLRLVRPVMAFFIKYEFWSNFLHILKHRNIPTYSVSSIFREDQVFFKWYGRNYAGVLKCFTRFFVQNEESKRLLEGIGITAVDVVGDTRFDRVLQIKEAAKQLPICEAFRTGVASSQSADVPHHDFKVFVAGSSWPPDENIFIPFFNEHKDWRLLIAPHVIAEEHLKLILSLIKGKKVVPHFDSEIIFDILHHLFNIIFAKELIKVCITSFITLQSYKMHNFFLLCHHCCISYILLVKLFCSCIATLYGILFTFLFSFIVIRANGNCLPFTTFVNLSNVIKNVSLYYLSVNHCNFHCCISYNLNIKPIY